MKAIHKKRLLKLYEYMRQPQSKLAHKKFNFDVFNSLLGTTEDNPCGTMGCMAGELPAIDPRNWCWVESDIRRKGGIAIIQTDLKEYFGLDYFEVRHLFYPSYQSDLIDPYYECHARLDSDATKAQVVANLRRFLKIKGIL